MSYPDLDFIPDESEEDELHRLHLQMEAMWKINRFPDEINLDSINEKERKLWEKSLIGKLFSSRKFDEMDIRDELVKSWNSNSKITITFLSKGLFKFSFEDVQEFRFVLENGPWSVHGYIMSLKQWIPDNPTNNYCFQEFRLWIQIFGLPLERSTWENIHKIGSAFGLVVAIDSVGGSDAGNSFSRVQVLYPIRRRMISSAMVNLHGKKSVQISFKYEKLPVFCYCCGLIGHDYKECQAFIHHPLLGKEGKFRSKAASVLPFSNRIRAASFKFGIGIQSRKVLEWDPKAEYLGKCIPMDFKLQGYNRKEEQPFVDLSSVSVSGFSEACHEEKLMVTEEGEVPSKVNGFAHNMDVTISEDSTDASMTSGKGGPSELSGFVADNSVSLSGASINDSLPSGNAVSSYMECNFVEKSSAFFEGLTSGKDSLSNMECNSVENYGSTSEGVTSGKDGSSDMVCTLEEYVGLPSSNVVLLDDSISIEGFPLDCPMVSLMENKGCDLESAGSVVSGSGPLISNNFLHMELGLDPGTKASLHPQFSSNMGLGSGFAFNSFRSPSASLNPSRRKKASPSKAHSKYKAHLVGPVSQIPISKSYKIAFTSPKQKHPFYKKHSLASGPINESKIVTNFADGEHGFKPDISEFIEKQEYESFEATLEEGKAGKSAHALITHFSLVREEKLVVHRLATKRVLEFSKFLTVEERISKRKKMSSNIYPYPVGKELPPTASARWKRRNNRHWDDGIKEDLEASKISTLFNREKRKMDGFHEEDGMEDGTRIRRQFVQGNIVSEGPLVCLEERDRVGEHGESAVHVANPVVSEVLPRSSLGGSAAVHAFSQADVLSSVGGFSNSDGHIGVGVPDNSGGLDSVALGSLFKDPFLKEDSLGSCSVSSLGSSLNPASAHEYDSSNPSFCSYGKGDMSCEKESPSTSFFGLCKGSDPSEGSSDSSSSSSSGGFAVTDPSQSPRFP